MTSTDITATGTDTGTHTSKRPTLVGVEGLVKGSVFPIEDGSEIIVGRSRSCDISLRKLESYRSMDPEDREKDHDFNTVSRSHIRIQVIKENLIRCEDISTNGTYCNDELVTEPVDIDLNSDEVKIIRLGARESFKVVLMDPSASAKKDDDSSSSSVFDEFEDDSKPAT